MDTLNDAALAFGASLLAAPVVLWLMRRVHVVDTPTRRSSHDIPTPRGGGLAPDIACALAVGVSSQISRTNRYGILAVAVCLGLIGLADDLRSRRVLSRLLAQIAVVALSLTWLLQGIGGEWALRGIAGLGIVLWVVGYANAFNFMDGINGLAIAQVVVCGVTWWMIGSQEHAQTFATAGLIAAAAALAFAPFNFPRARIFLGDVGSYFFGGWLAVVAILGLQAGIAPEAVLAPLTLFVLDAAVTLLQRVRRHEPWLQPHKNHVYQRIVQTGWSHGRTTLLISLVIATTASLGAVSLTGTLPLRAAGDVLGLGLLTAYLTFPSLLAHHSLSEPAQTSTYHNS